MGELGQLLLEKRQEKGLSLEQVEKATKIRGKHIKALEEGDFAALPERVYVKGLLRNYALYLGLDPKEVWELFEKEAEGAAEGEMAKPSAFRPMNIPLAPPSWLTPGLLMAILLGVALLAFGAWAAYRYLPPLLPTIRGEAPITPLATASKVPSAPTSTPLPTHTFTFTPMPTPSLTPVPTITPTSTKPLYGVEVRLRVVERSWLRVTVDGRVEFEGILEKGAQRTWRGDSVALRCGNAGGVEVTVNGEDLGLLGERGQVVELKWTKSE